MRGRMPTLFVRTEMPPCERDGVKCQNRHDGCHAECEEYLEYKCERDEYKKRIIAENRVNSVRNDSYRKWQKIEQQRHRRKQKK